MADEPAQTDDEQARAQLDRMLEIVRRLSGPPTREDVSVMHAENTMLRARVAVMASALRQVEQFLAGFDGCGLDSIEELLVTVRAAQPDGVKH